MRQKRCFAFCLILTVSFALFTGQAFAADPLSFSAPGTVTVDAGLHRIVALKSSPASADLGVDCGLAEMCGIDPCTCGSADEWGHCSCNGTKKTPVSYKAVVSDPSVAKVTVSGGKLLVSGLAAGTAKVTVTAQLKHYTDAVQTITVTVNPPWYLLWILPAGVAAAAVIVWRRQRRKKRMEQVASSNEK